MPRLPSVAGVPLLRKQQTRRLGAAAAAAPRGGLPRPPGVVAKVSIKGVYSEERASNLAGAPALRWCERSRGLCQVVECGCGTRQRRTAACAVAAVALSGGSGGLCSRGVMGAGRAPFKTTGAVLAGSIGLDQQHLRVGTNRADGSSACPRAADSGCGVLLPPVVSPAVASPVCGLE